MRFDWPSEMREKTQAMVEDLPMSYRKFVTRLNDAIEYQAKKVGKSQIDEESIVRGLITIIPRHLRDGIIETLSQHNYDVIYFRPVFDEPVYKPNDEPVTSTSHPA